MILYDKKGSWVTVPYRAELLSIPFEGGAVFNPLRTLDNSAFCTPERYGFEVVNTGGGCMGWRLDLPDGGYLLITDEGGSGLPEEDDDGSPLIGRYTVEGDCLALSDDFRELPANGSV